MAPTSAQPAPAFRRVTGNARFAVTIVVILAVLTAVNVLLKFGPPHLGLVLGPAVALVLVLLARRHGLTWDHLGAVGFTALAGRRRCELRRRSGSLLAAAGLHWATNALGVVLAATVWAVRTA